MPDNGYESMINNRSGRIIAKSLGRPLDPVGRPSVRSIRAQFNAASLAFLGDAVWEVFLRRRYFGNGRQPLHAYNVKVKRHASAAQQVQRWWLVAY